MLQLFSLLLFQLHLAVLTISASQTADNIINEDTTCSSSSHPYSLPFPVPPSQACAFVKLHHAILRELDFIFSEQHSDGYFWTFCDMPRFGCSDLWTSTYVIGTMLDTAETLGNQTLKTYLTDRFRPVATMILNRYILSARGWSAGLEVPEADSETTSWTSMLLRRFYRTRGASAHFVHSFLKHTPTIIRPDGLVTSYEPGKVGGSFSVGHADVSGVVLMALLEESGDRLNENDEEMHRIEGIARALMNVQVPLDDSEDPQIRFGWKVFWWADPIYSVRIILHSLRLILQMTNRIDSGKHPSFLLLKPLAIASLHRSCSYVMRYPLPNNCNAFALASWILSAMELFDFYSSNPDLHLTSPDTTSSIASEPICVSMATHEWHSFNSTVNEVISRLIRAVQPDGGVPLLRSLLFPPGTDLYPWKKSSIERYHQIRVVLKDRIYATATSVFALAMAASRSFYG